ncbi:MAG: hypothetical protein KAT26_10935 [Marinosulfonomonas sp.]|nr:hypothetical protein [Marinosulfonomonas sp.]
MLKSDNGVELCFLPVETVIGAQVHVITDFVPPSTVAYDFSGLRTTSLTVFDTGEPIVLILRSAIEMVWELNIDAAANVIGVHLISDTLPYIMGLPENIPLTARYDIDDTGTKNGCVYKAVENPNLSDVGSQQLRWPNHSFQDLSGLHQINFLEIDLFAYAGAEITSFQLTQGGWEGGTAIVSRVSTQIFAELKAEGRSLLDQATPPKLPFLSEPAATLKVPEDLGRGKVWPWIVSEGYAIPVPAELIKYFCEVDRLIAMASGVVLPEVQCKWGNYRRPITWVGLLLLGPVEMSDETCRMANQIRPLFAKSGIAVTTEILNCSMYTIDINRKTYR